MKKKIAKSLLLLFILIILFGVAGFNPLRSTKENNEYTPITSDLPFIFGDDNGTLILKTLNF